ncbi:putative pumilio-repeat, RNA-binding protein [Trypanosoma grayi]|uniref:putative pumilio-repeat, RNA-binding protein n=1 Tax=Trypanosoma grayi TaxID=71804 RepID=UPI0004F46759|nr:putative pumilio-repeat, RNA-binding protein [Trypanosoma grayi]KEG11432.1 putative pumilio-repeat, RNA-binding protein [Trypanosoma grayi]
MERPPGPMHEVIRRVYEDVRLYSNYYGAIKLISAVLHQTRDFESSAGQNDLSKQLSVDQAGGAFDVQNDSVVVGTKASEHSTASHAGGQPYRQPFSQTVMQGTVLQGDVDGISRVKDARPRLVLNRTQRLRLLLLRADAYSATKQHEKALEDAKAALQLSNGRSAEAFFITGRELLRLFRIAESVSAFEEAESLLLMSIADGSPVAEEITDEDFWAQRGFQMKDVEELKLSRREVEQREQENVAAACNGAIGVDASPNSSDLGTPKGDTHYDNPDLVQWRRLEKEARALLKMRTSRTLPVNVLQTTLALLDRRVNAMRNGVVACVENTTSRAFRLVGYSSPDATFHAGMEFPSTIPPGFCGLALLHPRGWGGYIGSVCYEVAEKSVCCCFCFESSFMGTLKCGVRFVSERRSVELSNAVADVEASTLSSAVSGNPIKELSNFKIPNPSLWLPTHVAPLSSGRKLKVSGATRGGSRSIVFSVAEVLPVRLRSVELLTALEFAGPVVIRKLSAVSRRYRELVNNLPPPLLYGAGRRAYPDYCLRSDRVNSPWIVHDKEPVKWNCIFDGRSINRENFVMVDSTDLQNNILWVSGENSGSVEAMVYYGDRRSPMAQIKGSWVPFSNTLYLCTPSGRTFASCFLNQSSQLALAWSDAGIKSKVGDVQYVMHRREPSRRGDANGRGGSMSSFTAQNGSMDLNHTTLVPTTGPIVTSCPLVPTGRTSRGSTPEVYAVWRPLRTSGGAVASSEPNQTNGGMELVAEVTIHVPQTQTLLKGTTVGEIKLFAGADALLVSLMAYCRFQWEN